MRRKLYGATTRERLEYHREVDENGCWVWPGAKQPNGYGRITVGGRARFVHRVAYVEFVGPIPDGLVVDHVCRNRACFNPEHLRCCTQGENTLAPWSQSPAALCARQTACKRGHDFTPENTRITGNGKRQCKTCARARDRARAATPERQQYERERGLRRRETKKTPR